MKTEKLHTTYSVMMFKYDKLIFSFLKNSVNMPMSLISQTRYFMSLTNKLNTNQDNKLILKESIEEKLYQIIRKEIQNGVLRRGTNLVQGTLAERYGVSRIPVRSALQLIEKDGLIQKVNNKGSYVVTEYNKDEISEMIELSRIIELKVVADAFGSLNSFALKQLTTLNRKIQNCSINDYNQLNFDFHLTLFSYSHKKHFKRFAAELRDNRPMYMSVKDYEDVQKAYEEHKKMIESIKDRDINLFLNLYEEHVCW